MEKFELTVSEKDLVKKGLIIDAMKAVNGRLNCGFAKAKNLVRGYQKSIDLSTMNRSLNNWMVNRFFRNVK